MITDNRWGIIYCPKHEPLHRGKKWERIEQCLHENNIEFDFVQSEIRVVWNVLSRCSSITATRQSLLWVVILL